MRRIALVAVIAPFAIPAIVFLMCALTEGMSLTDSLTSLSEQFTARRQNLFMIGALGLFPVGILMAILWIHRKRGGDQVTRRWMAGGGLIPILLVIIWVNFDYWPAFLPSKTYPGFPHGLEFVIGPGLFAPILMLPGIALGWWAARNRHGRRSIGTND
jgi:hypothetical protein